MKSIQGTPWHIGFTKIQEGDTRRHKSKCIFYGSKEKSCLNRKSVYFGVHCGGSAHCDYYEERGMGSPNYKNKKKKPSIISTNSLEENLDCVKANDRVEILNCKSGEVTKYKVIWSSFHEGYPPLLTKAMGKRAGEEFKHLGIRYKINAIHR